MVWWCTVTWDWQRRRKEGIEECHGVLGAVVDYTAPEAGRAA